MAVRANTLSGREWLLNSFSVWRDFTKDNNRKLHPAAFPLALVKKVLDCYAPGAESLVLDPFAGSGSVLLAATHAHMRSVGMDINAKYEAVFHDRLDIFSSPAQGNKLWRYEVCDARDRIAFFNVVQKNSVDVCVTSPPYWDILRRRRSSDGKDAVAYSDMDTDIGNITGYDEFLDALSDVMKNVTSALKPRGYLILNVMDLRKGSKFYPLHQDCAVLVQKNDSMTLDDIIIWDRQKDYSQMRPLGYPHKFIINKVHEYLLVFRKIG